MYSSMLAVLAASGLVSLTSTPAPSYYALNQIARVSADTSATPFVAGNPLEIYQDIFFQGFEVFIAGVAGATSDLPGVEPQSPPNLITYGTLGIATIDQGTPELTVVYPDTTIDHFSFFSFFYGCVLSTEETVLGMPQPCTVTVTGIDKNGMQVAQQAFEFNTNGGLSEQMVEAKLVGFTGLQSAIFSTSASLAGLPENATTATVADTFNYTVFGQNPISP